MVPAAIAPWLAILAVLLLLAFSAFLAGAASALTFASRAQLLARSRQGNRRATRALALIEGSERLIGALRFGGNVANILGSAVLTGLALHLVGGWGAAVAALVFVVLVLTVGEVLPRSLATLAPERTAERLAPAVAAVVAALAPTVGLARMLVRRSLRVAGVDARARPRSPALREEILGAIALGQLEGTVEKEDRDRLLGALDLGERTVEEAMRHRSTIEMLDADLPLPELVDRALSSSHSRLPLFRGEPDNVVGILHSKDLMRAVHARRRDAAPGTDPLADFDITTVARKPWFVPETTMLDTQMQQFLKLRRHFALVVDEYGTLQGLITLEDILEEIVGEIADEYDVEPPPLLHRGGDGTVTVEGAMAVRDFNRATEWALPDDEANTVAGLLIHEAQTLPEAGQVFQFHGYRFEVLQRKENRLTRLRIGRAGTTGP